MRITDEEIEQLNKAKNLLDVDLTYAITIKEIAGKVELNETKLTLAFKKLFGTTIYKYQLNNRMVYARELIEKGNSVKEVAYKLHYNPKGFSRAFKKFFGKPPENFKAYIIL